MSDFRVTMNNFFGRQKSETKLKRKITHENILVFIYWKYTVCVAINCKVIGIVCLEVGLYCSPTTLETIIYCFPWTEPKQGFQECTLGARITAAMRKNGDIGREQLWRSTG